MPYNELAHWRREEDDYFRQIGLLDRLMKDPIASYGANYKREQGKGPIDMGGEPSEQLGRPAYGLYSFRSNSPTDPGRLDVDPSLPPDQYGAVIAHELGHVGSRWLTDDAMPDMKTEEDRQRLRDVEMLPAGSKMSLDATSHVISKGGPGLPKFKKLAQKNKALAGEAKRRLDNLKKAKESTKGRHTSAPGKTDKES